MTVDSCRDIIASEDTLDFFVQYSGNLNSTKELYDAECVLQLNANYAVVYLNRQSSSSFRYVNGAFPRLYGLMDMNALESAGVLRIRRTSTLGLLGSGVMIGIIDTGIDYRNRLFRAADGSTRILSIWDQTIQTGSIPETMDYGSEYTAQDINRALASDDPYSIVPSIDENGHGTAMAAIAAGNIEEENNFSGAAPLSDLVVVKLKPAKRYLRDYLFIREGADAYQENDIAMGFKYLLRQVMKQGRPMVMCVGMGTNQGGHDGTGILDEYLNNLGNITGICIIVPAGNEGNARGHVRKRIITAESIYQDIQLRVGSRERGFALELWGRSPEFYIMTVTSPSGESALTATRAANTSEVIEFIFDRTVIYVDYYVTENRTGDPFAILRFDNPSEGIWTIRTAAVKNFGGVFDMWLPIQSFISEGTYFPEADPDVTITGPGNAERLLTVTAYDNMTGSLYVDASRGYTRVGKVKPDVAAPGVNLAVPVRLNPAGSGEDVLMGTYSGSSMSAAVTAGVSAMLLEWGIIRGNRISMNTTEVKNLLYKGAVRSRTMEYPNRSWGYGSIDVYESLNSLRGV